MNRPIKVLLAEDELSLAQIVQESLETRGFMVDLAKDGEEAQNHFNTNSYDILVLDVMMPKLDGYGVCQELRKESDIPIIMLLSLIHI